jgi:hypothetical protein
MVTVTQSTYAFLAASDFDFATYGSYHTSYYMHFDTQAARLRVLLRKFLKKVIFILEPSQHACSTVSKVKHSIEPLTWP